MGCCFSRPRGPNSPYPGPGPAPGPTHQGSSRTPDSPQGPIQPLSLPPPSTDLSPTRSNRHRSRPLGQHINKPLRRKEWSSAPSDGAWSRAALDRERRDFFDTRVTGHAEVWMSLRAALEVLWESDAAGRVGAGAGTVARGDGEAEAQDGERLGAAEALATAQSIIDAADITLPTGNLADGAYDSLGNYYQLPLHVVSDPTNMVSDDDEAGDLLAEGKGDVVLVAGEVPEDADDADVQGERRREEKGKSVVEPRSLMSVVVRMSDTSRDLRVRVAKDETVRGVIRRIEEETGRNSDYSRTHRIRIAHFGKILQENAPLTAQGWQPGQILSAFVHDAPL